MWRCSHDWQLRLVIDGIGLDTVANVRDEELIEPRVAQLRQTMVSRGGRRLLICRGGRRRSGCLPHRADRAEDGCTSDVFGDCRTLRRSRFAVFIFPTESSRFRLAARGAQ